MELGLLQAGHYILETPPSPRGGGQKDISASAMMRHDSGRENGENVKEIGRKGNLKEKWLVKVENNVNRGNLNVKKVSEE